jgi:protease-4
MQIVRESIFVSAIRSFFNTFLSAIGVVFAIILFAILSSLFSPPFKSDEEFIEPQILPDLNGSTEVLPETAPVILQIDFTGIIGDNQNNAKLIETYLRASRKTIFQNNRVKALLLYIDSPGGAAIDSDLIHNAIQTYKNEFKVPVFAYTPGICASGGYMIACASDKIFASPVSIVGSVGVKWGLGFNFWNFMQKNGIDSVTITEGLNKEKYPTFTKLPEGTKSYDDLIRIVNESYDQFTTLVSNARNDKGLSKDLLVSKYGASVFTGPTAKEYGYVDEGNLYYKDVLTELVKSLNLEKSPYQVMKFSVKHSPLQELVSSKFNVMLEDIQKSVLGIEKTGKLNNALLYYYDPK